MRSHLRCEGLGVTYGRKIVFEGLTLALSNGLHGLRGPNGIGKSTFLRVLAGAQRPDAGDVWIDGKSLMQSPRAAREHVSYVADEAAVYPFMTGQDLLDFCAWAKKSSVDEVAGSIDGFGLRRHLATRFDAMSLGTRKKMMICAAFIGTPTVLLLDEPSDGLDSGSVAHLAAVLKGRSEEAVILMSSHDDDFLQTVRAVPLLMQDLIAHR